MFRSIRFRLTVWYVLLLAVILAAFSAGVYLTLRHNLSTNLNDSLDSRAEIMLGIVTYDRGAPTLEGSVSTGGLDTDDQFVRVYDSEGELTFDSNPATEGSGVDPAVVEKALDGETTTRTAEVAGETMRVRAETIVRDGATVGAIEVGLSEDDMSETLSTLLLILAIAYPTTLIIASAGGVFLAGRALSPIDRITRLAQRISAEDLSQRLDPDQPDDEVGRLARTFNEMIARLDAGFRRQRQFTADASHELRTPLTAMKGQVEVALARPRDQGDYRDVLSAVNVEVDRLIRLVGSLLTLARADAGELPIAAERVQLGELVAPAVEPVRPAAAEKRIEITLDGQGSVALQADQDLLLQLVLNLLDNAVKYTPEGGRVTVGWGTVNGEATFWVRDTGVGLAEEHRERIFDRFYRVDRARSRAEGGAGLGLSISRWIAEAHGGRITVESVTGSGSTFTVTLPSST